MEAYKLSPRKPDLLDELDALRKRRGIAYRASDLMALEVVHLEMKAFWQRNGWSEHEAHQEYLTYKRKCEIPFSSTTEEITAIKGRLLLLAHN